MTQYMLSVHHVEGEPSADSPEEMQPIFEAVEPVQPRRPRTPGSGSSPAG